MAGTVTLPVSSTPGAKLYHQGKTYVAVGQTESGTVFAETANKAPTPTNYTPANRPAGSSSASSSGGGGGSASVSYADPEAQRVNMEKTRGELIQKQSNLESRVNTVNRQVSAFDRAQEAVNRGIPVSAADAALLGLSSSEASAPMLAQAKLNKLRPKLNADSSALSNEVSGFQRDAKSYNVEAKNLKNYSIGSAVASRSNATMVAAVQGMNLKPAKNVPARASSGSVQGDALASLQENLFGAPNAPSVFGSGPVGQREGGVVSRAGKSFSETTNFFGEVGEGVGGQVGKAGGQALGVPFGFFSGIIEAGPMTVIKSAGSTVERQTQSKFAGQAVETAGEVGLLLIGGPKIVGGAVKGVKSLPSTLSSVARFTNGGKASTTSTFFRSAGTLMSDFKLGTQAAATGARTSLAITKAEQAGLFFGRVTRSASAAAKNPFISTPLLIGASLTAPTISEEVQKFSIPSQTRQFIESTEGQSILTEGFIQVQSTQSTRGPKLPSFSFGSTGFGGSIGQVGSELNFGFFGEEKSELGGISRTEVQNIMRSVAIERGLTGARAEQFSLAAAKIYKARQFGGLLGQLSISTSTEIMGGKLIGPGLTKSLTGKVAGPMATGTFKTAFKAAAKTTPVFVGLGILEGGTSVGVTELSQRRAVSFKDLPRRVQESPENFLIGGLAGGISAPALGVPIIGFGAQRALKAGKSPVSRFAGEATLNFGYLTDPFEFPGDTTAKRLFGSEEPSFMVTTKAGVETRKIGRVRVSTPGVVSILQPAGARSSVGVFVNSPLSTAVSTPTTQTVSTLSNTKTNTPTLLSTFTNTNLFNVSVPSLQSISTPSQINQPIMQPIQTNVAAAIPTLINIPIAAPLMRAGIPPLFPVSPFGEGGGFGGGRSRKGFFNEYAFATGLLGKQLARTGSKMARERKSLFGFFKKRKRSRKSRRNRK